MKGNVQLSLIAEICELHAEIMGHARTTLDKAIRIGQLLTEQKAKLKHGNWLPWIDANLPFSVDTAGRYMTVFKRRNEIPQRAEFQLTDAYRLLAAPAEAEPELDLETQTVAESQTICVAGDAEEMKVTHAGTFFDGHWSGWEPENYDGLRQRISGWVEFAIAEQSQWHLLNL